MARRTRIKDEWREYRLFANRVLVAALSVALLFGVLIARLVWLQVIEHAHYVTLSEGNRVRIEPLAPIRGLIFDRNGVLLAENLPNYQLEIIPEQVDDLDATLAELGKLIELRPADLERLRKLLDSQRRFQAIPLRYNLSETEVAAFAINRYLFPGVDIRARLVRHYPYGASTAHVVGYVGAISERELVTLNAADYAGITHIGKTGIEKQYEDPLHGTPGYQRVEANAQGRPLRVLESQPPVAGNNLYLNLDIRLQQEAEKALGDYKGVVVALDPRNGEVLALVSRPAFDPNLFVGGIDQASYDALLNDRQQPLFNRFLNGHYPPGSTIKPFIALGALYYGIDFAQQNAFCSGSFQLESFPLVYRCWNRSGHGYVDLHDAIVESCDVYFYELAVAMGIDRIHDFLAHFGLGQPTGLDLLGEFSGLLPSREWKQRTRHMPWFPGETVITGIGQGFMLTTPLQLAQATALLAMRGKSFHPTLLRATGNPTSGELLPHPATALPPVDVKAAYWNQILSAMHDVVQNPHGTAYGSGWNAAYPFAGKSGTAQVFTRQRDLEYEEEDIAMALRDHGLFIAFAPLQNPRIAVAVVVENGGGGSSVAAPVARQVIYAWLLQLAPRETGETDVVQ